MVLRITSWLGLSLLGIALISLSGCVTAGDKGSIGSVKTAEKQSAAAYPMGDLLPAQNPRYDSEPLIPAEFTGAAPEAAKPVPPSRAGRIQVAYAGNVQDLSQGEGETRVFEPTRVIEYQDPVFDVERLEALQIAQSDSGTAKADSAAADLEAANQAIANPLAQATLVITENDTVFLDGDLSDETKVANVTVFEPLVPVGIGEVAGKQWSLVNRPILPFAVNAPIPVAGGGGGPVADTSPGVSFDEKTGLGDFTFFSLLTPVDDSPIKWGVGPIFRFPTATDERLGAEKFSAGPAAVVLYSSKKLTVGALNQNLFSFAGDGDRNDVAVSTLQYFAFYNFTPEWGIGTAPIASINWEADDDDDKFLVPVGLGVAHSFLVGNIPTRVLLEGQYYAVQRESFGPEWNIRLAFAMVFPPLFD